MTSSFPRQSGFYFSIRNGLVLCGIVCLSYPAFSQEAFYGNCTTRPLIQQEIVAPFDGDRVTQIIQLSEQAAIHEAGVEAVLFDRQAADMELQKLDASGYAQDAKFRLGMHKIRAEILELDLQLSEAEARLALAEEYLALGGEVVGEMKYLSHSLDARRAESEIRSLRRQMDTLHSQLKLQQRIADLNKMTFDFQYDHWQEVASNLTVKSELEGSLVPATSEATGAPYQEGDEVAPGTVVAHIAGESEIVLSCWLPSRDARRVSIGDHVNLGFLAFGDKEYSGTVTKIGGLAESTRRWGGALYVAYQIKTTDMDRPLMPGMTAVAKHEKR